MIQEGDKLYVITRDDLIDHYKSVQSIHAATVFAFEHRDIFEQWYKQSNYICLCSVNSEYDLNQLIEKASSKGIAYSLFREPDIGDQITAITFEPSRDAKKLCSKLKTLKIRL